MIELYGLKVSATSNSIKILLLEKGIEFKEIDTPPSQDEAFLKMSPMGKIPFIKYKDKYIFETDAITHFINSAFPGPTFVPEDPFLAAKCYELIMTIKLYVEGPTHRLMSAAFYQAPLSKDIIDYHVQDCIRGTKALMDLVEFKNRPLLEELTIADFVAAFYLPISSETLDILKLDNPIKVIPGFEDYILHLIKSQPHIKRIYNDIAINRPVANWPALPEPWASAIK